MGTGTSLILEFTLTSRSCESPRNEASKNCLALPAPPLQRVAAAVAKLLLLWTENVISVGGAFNVLLFNDILFSKCNLCSFSLPSSCFSAVVDVSILRR